MKAGNSCYFMQKLYIADTDIFKYLMQKRHKVSLTVFITVLLYCLPPWFSSLPNLPFSSVASMLKKSWWKKKNCFTLSLQVLKSICILNNKYNKQQDDQEGAFHLVNYNKSRIFYILTKSGKYMNDVFKTTWCKNLTPLSNYEILLKQIFKIISFPNYRVMEKL